MRVERRCTIDTHRDAVWKVVSDPNCYPSFMANLARWEPQGDGPVGTGARYVVHWQIGSVPVGGIVEVVEFDDARDIAWIGITGIDLRGRIRLRDAGPDQTRVVFRLSYQAPGGLLGLVAGWVAARQVAQTLAATLQNLKKLVES